MLVWNHRVGSQVLFNESSSWQLDERGLAGAHCSLGGDRDDGMMAPRKDSIPSGGVGIKKVKACVNVALLARIDWC